MATDLETRPGIDDSGVQLEAATLREMYWQMLRARRTDERAWVLHRQGKIAFHISGIGHEAIQVGAAFALRPGYDYALPYYRDLAFNLAWGYTPHDFMLALFGREGEPTSGARQMPSHWGTRSLNIISQSSPVATQVPQAAGVALAIKLRGEDRVAYTSLGEGSTSQGDFYEGMNWAGVHKLPLICVVENNIYAISVPVHLQMAVPNVADRAPMFGVEGVIVDGNDVLACYRVVKEAAERARSGGGATLIEAKTYRPTPHSSDDDDRTYRPREEVEQWKKRDPLARFQAYLLEAGILDEQAIADYEARAREEIDRAQAAAEAAPFPPPEAALGDVFAPVDETLRAEE
ncbi:MAG TPA: thiamine pyrophosphate-dependent dehydrogenase E1 component subunit alpha [Chloroflexi bacterium]|nr:thiamine pyrophosphate-dependent dehydrogenase E1 component subunit alpha [Chloroflexota bacterium]